MRLIQGDSVKLGPLVTIAVRGVGALLSFLVVFFYSRSLGVEEAGKFFFLQSVVMIFAIVAVRGQTYALVKLVASASIHIKQKVACGLAIHASKRALMAAVPLGLIFCLLVFFVLRELGDWWSDLTLIGLVVATFPIVAVYILHGSSLQGAGYISKSLVVVNMVPSLVLLAFPLLLSGFGSAFDATVALLVASIVSLGFAVVFHANWFDGGLITDDHKVRLAQSSRPLFIYSIAELGVFWAPSLYLGALAGGSDVTIWNVLFRVASVLSLLIAAINYHIAPSISRLWLEGGGEVEKLCRSAVKLGLFLSVIVALPIVAFPEKLLSYFGDEMAAVSPWLLALVLANIVNVIGAPSGLVMIAASRETVLKNIQMLSTVVPIVILPIFVGQYGFKAAVVTSLAYFSIFHGVSYYYVHAKLGVKFLSVYQGRGLRG